MGIRDLVKAISPPWLQTGNAEKFLYIEGLGCDAILEKYDEGTLARFPGYGTPTALPYVGDDRLIPRGLTETDGAYATRLKLWLDSWRIAGSARSVLLQVLGYLSADTPQLRTVSDDSAWDTLVAGSNPDLLPETAHYLSSPPWAALNWNWDNERGPDPHNPLNRMWWRWWLILYTALSVAGGSVTAATNASPIAVTTSLPHGLATGAQVVLVDVEGNIAANGTWTATVVDATHFSLNGSTGSGAWTGGGTVYAVGAASSDWARPEGTWGDGALWGDPSASWGLSVPATVVGSIRNIVGLWKQAGSWCRWMLVSFSPALFDPQQPDVQPVNPDGTFAYWSKIVNNQYVPARFADARYCDGAA
jgi:hypothetical protein